jgi:hypothetical protein
MADMEKRLLDEFGLVRADTKWLVAWDMRPKAKADEAKAKTEGAKPEGEKAPPEAPAKP